MSATTRIMWVGWVVSVVAAAAGDPAALRTENRKIIVQGGVDPGALLAAMQRFDEEVVKCVDPEMALDPRADPRVRLSLELDSDGVLDEKHDFKTDIPPVISIVLDEYCIRDVMDRVKPAPAPSETVTFLYTFEVRASARGVALLQQERQDAWDAWCADVGEGVKQKLSWKDAILGASEKASARNVPADWQHLMGHEVPVLNKVASAAGHMFHRWQLMPVCPHFPLAELDEALDSGDYEGPPLFMNEIRERPVRPGGLDYAAERAAILRPMGVRPTPAQLADAKETLKALTQRLWEDQKRVCRGFGGTPVDVDDPFGRVHCTSLQPPAVNWKAVKADVKKECKRVGGTLELREGRCPLMCGLAGAECQEPPRRRPSYIRAEQVCVCAPGMCMMARDDAVTCVKSPPWHGQRL